MYFIIFIFLLLFSKSYIRISLYYNFIILFDNHIILNSESHHHFIYKRFFFQTWLPVFMSSYHKIRDHKTHRQNNILITTLTTFIFIVNNLVHINHPSHEESLSLPRKNGYNDTPRAYVLRVQAFSFCFGCLRDKAIFHKSSVSKHLVYYTPQNYPSFQYAQSYNAGILRESSPCHCEERSKSKIRRSQSRGYCEAPWESTR